MRPTNKSVMHRGIPGAYKRSASVARTTVHSGILMRIDSGASKTFMSDISLFHSCDEQASDVSFNTDAGTTITSRAVGTVKFKAVDAHGDIRTFTLNVPYAPTTTQSCGSVPTHPQYN